MPHGAAHGAPVLRVEDLQVSFLGRGGDAAVVRGVSFSVEAGRTLVIVGESGSGKSVTARSILRVHGRNARVAGEIWLEGQELLGLDERSMNRFRGNQVALIPQDATGALDPLRRVGSQISEVLRHHGMAGSRTEAQQNAIALMRLVHIPDPERVAASYPHQLSGGMRQRIATAIAISCEPRVLIADEPTTALDVTVQAQILDLLSELQARLGMALVMVTHDVGVAEQMADEVGVMYAGRLVERGPAEVVFGSPTHPYTAALLDAQPRPGVHRGELRPIPGVPPPPTVRSVGCPFAPRCDRSVSACQEVEPALERANTPALAACHRPLEVRRTA
jgi:oligopeptide/dipeptide ABC transporter ATP-binding protein